MRIDLLRHGTALSALPGSSDASRLLSEEGRQDLKVMLAQAKAAGVQPAVIIASPYTRAIETAELAAEILGYADPIEQDRALEPERSPLELWDEIRSRKIEGEILLVGHQPLLGDLAMLLLRRSVRLNPGTMLRIDVPNPVPEPKGTLLQILEA